MRPNWSKAPLGAIGHLTEGVKMENRTYEFLRAQTVAYAMGVNRYWKQSEKILAEQWLNGITVSPRKNKAIIFLTDGTLIVIQDFSIGRG